VSYVVAVVDPGCPGTVEGDLDRTAVQVGDTGMRETVDSHSSGVPVPVGASADLVARNRDNAAQRAAVRVVVDGREVDAAVAERGHDLVVEVEVGGGDDDHTRPWAVAGLSDSVSLPGRVRAF